MKVHGVALAGRFRLFPLLMLLLAAAMATPAHAQNETKRPRRVVVFGIDGGDPEIFERLLKENRLPHFAALKAKGGYSRLATSNPAQSPVSWAQMITASNPGKTGIYDFLRRDPTVPGKIELSLAKKEWTSDGLPSPAVRALAPWVLGAVVGTLGFLLVLLVLRLFGISGRTRNALAIAFGVVCAGAAGPFTARVLRWIPLERPVAVNLREGRPLWKHLGEAGIASVVVEAPVSFPADQAVNLKLLAGLGVPDLQGTWGFYSIFTDEEKALANAETGGFVDHLVFDESGRARTRVYGPENITFTTEEKNALQLAEREAKLVLDMRTGVPSARRTEERALTHAKLAKNTSCILEVVRDLEAKQVTVRFGAGGPRPVLDLPRPAAREALVALPDGDDPSVRWSAPITLVPGVWSGPITLEFHVNPVVGDIRGVTRLRLEEPGGPGREFRMVMEPMNIDPSAPPPGAALSHPMEFAAELASKIGVYRTIGWPCLTNPVKDELLSDDAFMDHIRDLTAERRRKLKAAMESGDWRFLFVLFSEVDRVQHVMWRHTDPASPLYRADEASKFGGSIAETAIAMDEVLGDILAAAGDDTAVLVMSDHGFSPFRRGVNLNTFLLEKGFQANRTAGDGTGPDRNVGELFSPSTNFFDRVDWKETRAYALGLGQIYINLEGRERFGSVSPEQYQATCDAIRNSLLALRDGDQRVVREVYFSKDIFKGPTVTKYAPDLVVGFERGYRVSWQTTLGGGGNAVIEDNLFRWSGDHCSVDPSLVPGVLFSTIPLKFEGASVQDIAPTVLDLFGVEPPPDWDGKSLLR